MNASWIINVIVLSICLLQRLGSGVDPLAVAGNVVNTAAGALGGASPLGAATGAVGQGASPLAAVMGPGTSPLGAVAGSVGQGAGPLSAATNIANTVTGALGQGANPVSAATNPAEPTTNSPSNSASTSSPTNIQPPDSSLLDIFAAEIQNYFALLIQLLNMMVQYSINNSPVNSPVSNSSPSKQLPPLRGKRQVSETPSLLTLLTIRNQIQDYKNKNNSECNVYSICIAKDIMPELKTMVENSKPNEEIMELFSEFEPVENKLEAMFPMTPSFCSAVHQQCSLNV